MCDLMPATDGLPGLADTDIDGYLARLQAESPPSLWAGLSAGALLYAGATPFTVRSALPSVLLKDAEKDAHATQMAASKNYLVRQSCFLLKMYAGICWGQDPDVRRRMGLEPYEADPRSIRTR